MRRRGSTYDDAYHSFLWGVKTSCHCNHCLAWDSRTGVSQSPPTVFASFRSFVPPLLFSFVLKYRAYLTSVASIEQHVLGMDPLFQTFFKMPNLATTREPIEWERSSLFKLLEPQMFRPAVSKRLQTSIGHSSVKETAEGSEKIQRPDSQRDLSRYDLTYQLIRFRVVAAGHGFKTARLSFPLALRANAARTQCQGKGRRGARETLFRESRNSDFIKKWRWSGSGGEQRQLPGGETDGNKERKKERKEGRKGKEERKRKDGPGRAIEKRTGESGSPRRQRVSCGVAYRV